MSGYFTSPLVRGFLFAGLAVCCYPLQFLVPVVWLASSTFWVSTADCANGEVRRGSGGDVIVDAARCLSLGGATECFGDVIPVRVIMPCRGVTEEVGRSDKTRYGCGIVMGRGRSMAGVVALAT